MAYDDDEIDEDEDEDEGAREYPDDEEADWNLDPATIVCPYCRAEISEDASRCPECGEYISQEDTPRSRKPLWMVIGFVIVLIIVITWIL